ncbi:MAG: apolipoprotein N-acyltransferase [Phyllobacteriaceae bacterium]|nr:apolipoprotein N-acyltransferase [Phyllobacteriaceae bacterium]
MLERVAHAVTLSWGWRRAGIVALAGALGALSLAPFHVFPVLWISLPVLVWALDGAADLKDGGRLVRVGPAFLIGWAFGFGWFLAGLWWIGAAFLVDVEEFGWLMPIAVASLSIGLGLFHGLAAALARLLWSEGPARIAALAIGFYVADWLRGHVLTGFPWNLIGYGFAANEPMMQIDSVLGGYGLTLLAVVVFAAPAALVGGGRDGRRFTAAVAVATVAIVGWGAWRLHVTPTEYVPDLRFRIVQPSIDQWAKWRPEFKTETVARYVELSSRPVLDAAGKPLPAGLRTDGGVRGGVPGITHLVWPESAFPFVLTNEPWALATIAQLLGDHTTLLTGAVRAEAPAAGEVRHRFYNSIYALGRDAEILAAYDKAHLVPFGEYLPFQDTLESLGLRQLTKLRGGYSAGPGIRTVEVPGLPPFGPLVCYEVVFPGEVVDRAHPPQWLLNVTNDAWYGMTPGPWQHLHQARLRAVEEGLPIVRAANDGVSAFVDPLGRVVAELTLGAVGVVDSGLPRPLAATVFARWGSTPSLTLACLAFLWAVWRRVHLAG